MTVAFEDSIMSLAFSHEELFADKWTFQKMLDHLDSFHGIQVIGDRGALIHQHRKAHKRERRAR